MMAERRINDIKAFRNLFDGFSFGDKEAAQKWITNEMEILNHSTAPF